MEYYLYMELFKQYIVTNFVLICISVVLLIYAIQRFNQHKKISVYSILIVALVLVLSVVDFLQEYLKATGSYAGTFVCSLFGYSFRPLCIYLFILMTIQVKDWKLFWLTALPLAVNFFIYLLGIVPGVQQYVVHFVVNADGTIRWSGGEGVLRFSSHVVSLGYLAWMIFASLAKLRSKHISHGIIILLCSLFAILAVVIESFFNNSDDIQLINTTIVVCAMSYYLYLYIERTQTDTLTGLFNRETYYRDVPRMEKTITGIIQFDMNGLKYLNDNYGHSEGDHALSSIANAILKSSEKRMYAYRLGGDEFIVLANEASEEDIKRVVENFKNELNNTTYHCSIGYSYRSDKNTSIDDLIKEAETNMYKDKSEFYRNSKIERRKA